MCVPMFKRGSKHKTLGIWDSEYVPALPYIMNRGSEDKTVCIWDTNSVCTSVV